MNTSWGDHGGSVQHDEDEPTPASSKFGGDTDAERLWEISLEGGHDRECGDVETTGWFALFLSNAPSFGASGFGEGRAWILNADSLGFVTATPFDSDADALQAWAEIEQVDAATGGYDGEAD